MDYSKYILNKLIDEYEKKGCFNSDIENAKAVSFDIYKKMPEYSDRYNYDVVCEIESSIEKLLHLNYISAQNKDTKGYYHKLYLNSICIEDIYSFLNRKPLQTTIGELTCTLKKYLNDAEKDSILYNYCTQQLLRLENNKSLENQIGDDNEKLDDILASLSALLRLNKETYIRNFSEAVFHDSKKFSKIQSAIVSILKKYSNDPLEEEKNVLEWFNLFENPVYIYIKGDCIINYDNGKINVGAIKGGVAVSPASIQDIQHIFIGSKRLITVENLTTYHDTPEDNAVVLYLGGFHNSVRTRLLKSIYKDNSKIDFLHKGDLDVYGFLILENLINKTGIDFKPYEMDLETLKKCYEKGFFKELNKNDIIEAHKPILNKYCDVIDFMINNNCKVEQESLEAMKLDI